MKFSELRNKMYEFNSKHGIERKVCTMYNQEGKLIEMTGKVVIKCSALNQDYQSKYGPYPEASRTFEFSNYNKALTSGDGGYSIFAYCRADGDSLRIERYTDDMIESAEIVEIVE